MKRREISRTGAIIAAGIAAAAALAGAEAREVEASKFDRELARIAKGKGPTDKIVAAALAVRIDGEIVYAGAAGCAEIDPERPKRCIRPFAPDTKFRVASISKMALAKGIMVLADAGRLDIDADVSGYLGWPLRNPAYKDRPVTTRQLLSHLSSVRDPEEYWIDAPGDFRALFEPPPFAAPGAVGADVGPGAWFKYANLNYGVLAGVIEGASGERFDRFMTREVFGPLGLDIGYNWSGVSAQARRAGAVLYERTDRASTVVADPPAVLAGDLPIFRAAPALDPAAYLATYRPGENPTLFSPQGGLRASVIDLTALVASVAGDKRLTTPQWRLQAAPLNGDPEDGFYVAFGLGVQTVPAHAAFGGRSLVGHSGDAYGVHSGAWRLESADEAMPDVTFSFAATGVANAKKGAHPTFNAVEERLVALALEVERTHRQSDAGRSAFFDPSTDAMRDVDAALLAAESTGRNVLVVMGADWCHDSRSLGDKFGIEPLAGLIARSFHLVFVDVGRSDRNLDVAARFGVSSILGTPTILILSPEGDLLNGKTVHDWRNAESRPLKEAVEYFGAFAARPE